MYLNIWSYLLVAFLSQSLLLIIFISVKPASNRNAKVILAALLAVILLIQFSNLCEAGYVYRKVHGITNLFRGLGLLLGPLLYGYTLSILHPGFKLKKIYLLHSLPYFIAVITIYLQNRNLDSRIIVLTIDAVMNGTIKMTLASSLWFIGYFVQFAIYFILIFRAILKCIRNPAELYMFPMKDRVKWLKKMLAVFSLIVLMYLGITIYVLISGYYSVKGNFIYSTLLGTLIYIIAWQAYRDASLLNPHFDKRYRSITLENGSEIELMKKLTYFFDQEKVFLNPDVRIASLAKQMNTTPHILSKIINDRLGKGFTELVNEYRIEEAKKRLADPAFNRYSIMGIAMDVGFTSKSSFNKSFKRLNGQTPSQYLKHSDTS